MDTIQIEGMEFYAYHGHFEEERIIGNRFLVDLYISCDLTKSARSDNLKDTVNYHRVYQLIKKEMELKSHLLENIVERIISVIIDHFDVITWIKVKVSKMNPPMGGKIEKVSVVMERKR